MAELTLTSGLVARRQGWLASLENRGGEDVVPLLLDEWVCANRKRQIERKQTRRLRDSEAKVGFVTYSFFLLPFFLKLRGFFPAVMFSRSFKYLQRGSSFPY